MLFFVRDQTELETDTVLENDLQLQLSTSVSSSYSEKKGKTSAVATTVIYSNTMLLMN